MVQQLSQVDDRPTQWINSPEGRLIYPETGNEVKKSIFILAPYFPGLSESFKQLFKYTPI